MPQCGSIGYPLMVKRQMFFTTFERWLKELNMAHFGRGFYEGLVYNFHHCPRESYVSEGHGVTMDMVSECYVNWFYIIQKILNMFGHSCVVLCHYHSNLACTYMRFLHVLKKFTLYVEFCLRHVVCNCQVEVKGIFLGFFFGNDTHPMYVEGNIWLSCI